MSVLTLNESFKIAGEYIEVTSVKLSDPTGAYGVIRNDTEAVVVADGVAMTEESTGQYTYSFTQPADSLTYTYWVEWVYGGETFHDQHTVSGSAGADYHSTAQWMRKEDIVLWLAEEFKPLTLATPAGTLRQIVDNAVRYWNTHSGYKITTMFAVPSSGTAVTLNTQFKTVVQVYPSSTTTWIWNDHPLWTMLGITVLDNVTGDLILMSEAFRNYRIYVGTDFRWVHQKSDDPLAGSKLYAINVPSGVTHLAVVGTKRIIPGETIKVEYILDWVLAYSKALLKQVEGNTLRKSAIIDVKNDGQEYMTEGKEEQKDLKEALARDGRWVAIVKRA